MSFQSFEEFPVYQKALTLLLEIYQLTKHYPSDERFILVSDTNRSANSITHNIAEGFGRYSARDKTRFYKISRGSAYEIISQLIVAEALGYIDTTRMEMHKLHAKEIIIELGRLIKTLETR